MITNPSDFVVASWNDWPELLKKSLEPGTTKDLINCSRIDLEVEPMKTDQDCRGGLSTPSKSLLHWMENNPWFEASNRGKHSRLHHRTHFDMKTLACFETLSSISVWSNWESIKYLGIQLTVAEIIPIAQRTRSSIVKWKLSIEWNYMTMDNHYIHINLHGT